MARAKRIKRTSLGYVRVDTNAIHEIADDVASIHERQITATSDQEIDLGAMIEEQDQREHEHHDRRTEREAQSRIEKRERIAKLAARDKQRAEVRATNLAYIQERKRAKRATRREAFARALVIETESRGAFGAVPLEKAVRAFLDWHEHEMRSSGHTLRAYGSDLRAFLSSISPLIMTDAFDASHVKKYLATITHKSASTRARFVGTVRSFTRWLARSGRAPRDIGPDLFSPKVPMRLPRPIERPVVDRVLALATPAGPWGARDRALVELLIASGMRASELVGLNIGDLDLARRAARVLGKGAKQRAVLFGELAGNAIAAWLEARAVVFATMDSKSTTRITVRAKDALFINFKGSRLTPRSLNRILHDWAKRAGLLKFPSAHQYRHTFATEMLASGANLRDIQTLLGHSHIGVTQRYAAVSDVHVERAYHAASPFGDKPND